MANLITEWLDKSGTSKAVLAEALGMSRPTLYARLERGDWSLEEAYRLAEFMGCTVEELARANRKKGD